MAILGCDVFYWGWWGGEIGKWVWKLDNIGMIVVVYIWVFIIGWILINRYKKKDNAWTNEQTSNNCSSIAHNVLNIDIIFYTI